MRFPLIRRAIAGHIFGRRLQKPGRRSIDLPILRCVSRSNSSTSPMKRSGRNKDLTLKK